MHRFFSKTKSFCRYSLLPFLRHPLLFPLFGLPAWRFFKLNLFFLLGAKSFEYTWLGSIRLKLYPSEHGLSGNYYFGLHEFSNMAFAFHLLREDDIFLDVGANVGSYSLMLSRLKSAVSYAYEPIPHTYHKLCLNIQLNNLQSRVTTKQVCLTSAENHFHPIYMSTTFNCANSVASNNFSQDLTLVNGSTLDIETTALDSLTLVKIDVEGHELSVLQGFTETLTNNPPLCLLVESREDKVNQLLRDKSYNCYQYMPFTRNLVPSLPSKGPDNALWIHDTAYISVEDRVKTSKAIKIFNVKV